MVVARLELEVYILKRSYIWNCRLFLSIIYRVEGI